LLIEIEAGWLLIDCGDPADAVKENAKRPDTQAEIMMFFMLIPLLA
jgi:hypothetical protein